jgi:hypothetical protein
MPEDLISKKIKIETLKDIKEYLEQFPDEDLERLMIGHNWEGGDGEICVLACEQDVHPIEGESIFERVDVRLFNKLINKICDQQTKLLSEGELEDVDPFFVEENQMDDGDVKSNH